MSCPICGETTDPQFRPFCSRRCADIDLGRWLTGSYAIPAEEEEADEDTAREGRERGAGDKPH
ncbi:DNA gyrase inhibitor YacG [Acidimangrovimonas pyrenivorans]|uniref:DNA gyrase inhibitor YacG n=1 Tax=Acidimangrovimonas pyrenivorans TaxID=2030798 RepID=A0ABV7AD45_9RHOB